MCGSLLSVRLPFDRPPLAEDKGAAALAVLSGRASKIWMSLEKNKMLSREMIHLPFNLELICSKRLGPLAVQALSSRAPSSVVPE